MKVAVIVSTFPPYKGGMGNVAAAHAEAFRRAGHEVAILAPGNGLRPLLRFGNAAWAPQLLWKLRRFDVVELHYPFFGGAEWVWLWKRLFGRRTPLVVVYHMDTVGRGPLGLIFTAYRALLLAPILRAADRIVVTSRDYLASSQAAAFADDPRVREVPLSVDIGRFRPDGEGTGKTALFVGALDRAHYFKGVDILLEAFTSTLKVVPDARLVLVGEGDRRAVYERKAFELGLAGHLQFVGKVPDEDLPHRYRRARFLVLPSVDRSEAFGMVTLEAAASGTPAIVSDLPGVRTTVEEDVTGVRVPPGDVKALSRAMTDLFVAEDRAKRMGRAARQRAERLYAPAVVDRKLLEAVLGE
jgi:glycosyltransferase involved in cell wall biosynthesis